MRLFKNIDNYEPLMYGSFSFITVEDTTPITNSYGCWIEDDSDVLSIDDFDFDVVYSIDEDLLLSEWKELLDYDFTSLNKEQVDTIIKLSNYKIDYSDDADSSIVYDIDTQSYGIDVQECEPCVVGEKYSYYDGSNWKDVILNYDNDYVPFEEITNEYIDSFDDKEEIYSYKGSTGGVNYYAIKTDDGYALLVHEWSMYYGSENNTYIYVDNKEEIALLVAGKVEDIEAYFPFVIEEYGDNLILTECETIISKDDLVLIESVNQRNGGYDLYNHPKYGEVKYNWTCYQGSKNTWTL